MRRELEDLPRPDPTLHQTGSEGLDGHRGRNELRTLEHFGMQPSSDILDIGCGIGRLTYECASYLDEDATYTGLDIAPVVIDWLNAQYAPRLPGFRFDLLDVHSERYAPTGAVAPDAVRLPYDDASFDVVCAFEVFMHVPLDGVRNYLREIARVLRPRGLAVVTLVAVYPGEDDLSQSGRPYVRVADGVYTRFPRRTNVSMAYDVALVRSALDEAGLEEVELVKGGVHRAAERRRRLVGERLAADGVDVAALLGDRPVVAVPGSPDAAMVDEVPAVSHSCDLFATRKR